LEPPAVRHSPSSVAGDSGGGRSLLTVLDEIHHNTGLKEDRPVTVDPCQMRQWSRHDQLAVGPARTNSWTGRPRRSISRRDFEHRKQAVGRAARHSPLHRVMRTLTLDVITAASRSRAIRRVREYEWTPITNCLPKGDGLLVSNGRACESRRRDEYLCQPETQLFTPKRELRCP
jgi:hypothetical protein